MKRNKNILLKLLSFGVVIPAIYNYFTFKTLSGQLYTKYKQFFYEWKYGNIRYIKKGNGKPILLVHGIGAGANLDEWNSSIDLLSKNYTVYAIDLLGFGNSDRPAISYSSYLYTELINDFIEEVIERPAYVISASNSANIALISHKFKPELITKLMLISPTGIENIKRPYENWSKILGKIIDTPHIGTTIYNIMTSRIGTAYFLYRYAYYDKSKISYKLVSKYHFSAHNGGISSKYPIGSLLTNHFSLNIKRHLKDIEIPVHIVWGAENTLNPINNIYNFDEINKEIYISIIENTALLPHVERPKAFVGLCEGFFGE